VKGSKVKKKGGNSGSQGKKKGPGANGATPLSHGGGDPEMRHVWEGGGNCISAKGNRVNIGFEGLPHLGRGKKRVMKKGGAAEKALASERKTAEEPSGIQRKKR